MSQFIWSFLNKIHHALLPYTCLLCQERAERKRDLCDTCFHALPFLKQTCRQCGQALLQSINHCGACLKNLPAFDATYTLCAYEKPITHLLRELKYGQKLVNANVLGMLLADYLHTKVYINQPVPQAIIPVPLHLDRLKERGFNQALELARPVAALLQCPIDSTLCQRTKATLPQTALPSSRRMSNMNHAFTVQRVPYLHVAIIDDVITTGNTLQTLSACLKQQGVQKIDAWCIARSQR